MSGHTTLEHAARVIYEALSTEAEDVSGIAIKAPDVLAPRWHELTDVQRTFWVTVLRDAVLPDQLNDADMADAMESKANGADRITLTPAVSS